MRSLKVKGQDTHVKEKDVGSILTSVAINIIELKPFILQQRGDMSIILSNTVTSI